MFQVLSEKKKCSKKNTITRLACWWSELFKLFSFHVFFSFFSFLNGWIVDAIKKKRRRLLGLTSSRQRSRCLPQKDGEIVYSCTNPVINMTVHKYSLCVYECVCTIASIIKSTPCKGVTVSKKKVLQGEQGSPKR